MEWILCKDKLPEENQDVLLTFRNNAGTHVGEATFKNDAFYYVALTHIGEYEEKYGIPIAWMKMPEPYNQ